MNKQMTLIIGIIVVLLIAGAGAYTFMNSNKTESSQAGEVQDESKPHTDATPHAVDETKPHLDASPHASETAESTGSTRKPAAVGDHVDTEPHASEEPHN